MNIILLGAPGCGKGTQSEKIVENNNFQQFSTGELMRKAIKDNSDLGHQCAFYINQGKLVPDNLTNSIVEKALINEKGNLIFDGYPRTIDQLNFLDKTLKNLNSQIDFIFFIDVSEKLLIERIAGRLICPKCKTSYHITNRRPKVAMICDKDGTGLIKRVDDDENKVKVRLEIYKQDTQPIVEYYKNQPNFIKISADNLNSDQVYQIISEKINNDKN